MEGLVSDLATLLKTSSGSDMILVSSDGGEVKVHSVIMIARSPVFRGMLESGMVEQSSRRVEVKDFGLSVVEAFVQYIYTAHIGEEFETLVELLKIGNKYLVDTLMGDCAKKLALMLSENKARALSLGAMAEVLSCEELLESCAKFVAKNVEVLSHGWEKEMKDSPMFLMKIINCMKSTREEAIVHRLQRPSTTPMWGCGGDRADAITIHLDKMVTLSSVGFYGTETVRDISVKIDVYDDQLRNILTKNSVFKSTGSAEPIQVPVYVEMLAGKNYTVSALINSGTDHTFRGTQGYETVKVNDSLVVRISDSEMSLNHTSTTVGQIPTLGFIIR